MTFRPSRLAIDFDDGQVGSQIHPHLAELAGGGFVMVWQDFPDAGGNFPTRIVAQIFNADGTLRGGPFEIASSLTALTGITLRQHAVTALDNGNFVVTLSGLGSDPVVVRVFGPQGNSLSGEITINTTVDSTTGPRLVSTDYGFAVIWQGYSASFGPTPPSSIIARRYSFDGTPLSGEVVLAGRFIPIPGTTFLEEELLYNPQATTLADGNLLVMWDAEGQLRFNLFNPLFQPIGQERNLTIDGGIIDITGYHATSLAGGGFVITWSDRFSRLPSNDGQSRVDADGSAVYAAIFDSTGSERSRFLVNIVSSGSQSEPRVDALEDGGFVISYTSGTSNVFVRHYSGDGTPISGEILVETNTFARTDVLALSDYRILVAHAGNQRADVEFLDRVSFEGGPGDETFVGNASGNLIYGGDGSDRLDGAAGNDAIYGELGADRLTGGLGNDIIHGGSNIDTAVARGARAQYTVTQTATGVFRVAGPDGTDTLTAIEFLQFDDQILRLRPGAGVSVNFNSTNPAVYQSAMNSIRDFDGNALGGNGSWLRIGQADVNGDGDVDQILVNRAIGRFATVGTAPDGLVYFSDHNWAGETRVAGIYIDPLVAAGVVQAGSGNDSQRRFQNDLQIENINRVLGAGDYDRDGLQEVYFALTDGTAYLRAIMEFDGNIRYANYQSQQGVIDYLTANGFNSSTWAGWFPAPSSAAASSEGAALTADAAGGDTEKIPEAAFCAMAPLLWQPDIAASEFFG